MPLAGDQRRQQGGVHQLAVQGDERSAPPLAQQPLDPGLIVGALIPHQQARCP